MAWMDGLQYDSPRDQHGAFKIPGATVGFH
jgi:hypothetical protein